MDAMGIHSAQIRDYEPHGKNVILQKRTSQAKTLTSTMNDHTNALIMQELMHKQLIHTSIDICKTIHT